MAIQNRQEFLNVLSMLNKGTTKGAAGKAETAADIGKIVNTSFANVASTITNSIETTGKQTQLEIREGADDPETRREAARAEKLKALKEKSKEQKEDVLLKKESFFGKTLGGIKGLFSGLGAIAKVFGSMGGFLLKPFKWLGGLGKVLKIARALFIGIGGIFLAFTGLTLAGAMMKPEDYEKLKTQIAGGVATVVANLIGWAMDIWNEFAPKSWTISEDDKKKYKEGTFKTVNDSILAIMKFADDLSAAFGEGFGTEWTGIKEKFAEFKTAWTDVFNQLKEKSPDGKETLFSVVSWLGTAFGKFVKGLLTIGTFIANLITDPTETIAKFQVSIEDIFRSVSDTIARAFDNIFNIENFIKMLPEAFPGKDSLLAAAAERRARQKQEEIDEINENTKRLKEHKKRATADIAALKAEGGEIDQDKLRTLTLILARADKEIERETKNLLAVRETQKASLKTAIDRETNIRVEAVSDVSVIKLQKEITDLKALNKSAREDTFGVGQVKGTHASFTAITDYLKTIKKYEGGVLKGKDFGEMYKTEDGEMKKRGFGQMQDFSLADLTPDQMTALRYEMKASGMDKGYGDVDLWATTNMKSRNRQFKSFIDNVYANMKQVADRQAGIASRETVIETTKQKWEPAIRAVVEAEILENVIATHQEGTSKIPRTGLYGLHAGEQVIDAAASSKIDDFVASYLPSSGIVLQQLAARVGQGGTALGSNITDNSAVVNNFNQTTIVPSQPRGPSLWGEQGAVA